MSLFDLKPNQHFILTYGSNKTSMGIYCRTIVIHPKYIEFRVENGAWEGRLYEDGIMIVMEGPSSPDMIGGMVLHSTFIPQNADYRHAFEELNRTLVSRVLRHFWREYLILPLVAGYAMKRAFRDAVTTFKKQNTKLAYRNRKWYAKYPDMDDDIPF